MAILAITRKPNDSVWIGETKVTLRRKKKGSGLMLIIEASDDIEILRDEIKKRKMDETGQEQIIGLI